MDKMSAIDVIIDYFKASVISETYWFEFGNSMIPVHMPEFGYRTYDVLYSPDTYSRKWRLLKEEYFFNEESKLNSKLHKAGFELKSIEDKNRREKVFQIRRI